MARVLVCAAHPDDETIGAGGAIARHARAGDEVHIAVFTRAYPPDWSEEVIAAKRREAEAAAKVLGAQRILFFGFPTAKLDTVPQKDLNDRLAAVVREVLPETVYTTHRSDVNKDHRLVFDTTLVATRPVPGCAVRRVLSYELRSSTEWSGPFAEAAFLPACYVDIAATLPVKLAALGEYLTELKAFPHPRSLEAVEALARTRGAEVGIPAAEAFEVVRDLR